MNHPSTPTQDRASSGSLTRWALGLGIPLLITALAALPLLAFRSDLPDRLATHFELDGTPDDSMTVAMFVIVTGALIAVGSALCIGTALRRPSEGSVATTTGFLGGFVGALAAAILASTVVSQRGLDEWQAAGGAGWTLAFSLVSATALGALGAWLASRIAGPESSGEVRADAPVMTLGSGEHAAWHSSLRSTPLLALGFVSTVIGLVLVGTANWVTGAIVMASGLPLTALATLHVSADRTGLRVRYGWLPWPQTHVDIDDIETAQVIDVRPMEWGGWGYRGSLKLMKRAAVVHRAGPGVRLDLAGGKVFAVTIDDPETAVALLNAEVQRSAELSQPTR